MIETTRERELDSIRKKLNLAKRLYSSSDGFSEVLCNGEHYEVKAEAIGVPYLIFSSKKKFKFLI